jgi:hypothetical protein
MADTTDSVRSRSASKRKNDAPTTIAGKAAIHAIHNHALLIAVLIASACRAHVRSANNDVTQQTIDMCQIIRGPYEWRHHHAIDDAVQKSTLERNQI